jgi:hypothetical protein
MTLPISALSLKAELNITFAEQASKGGGKFVQVWATFSGFLHSAALPVSVIFGSWVVTAGICSLLA